MTVDLATCTSAWGTMSVISLATLLPEVGSTVSEDVISAELVIEPTARSLTIASTSICTGDPAATVGNVHTAVVWLQLSVGRTSTMVNSGGSVSVTSTFCASEGPSLITSIVYVTVAVGSTGSTSSFFSRRTSAEAAIGVTSTAELGNVPPASEVVVLTVAVLDSAAVVSAPTIPVMSIVKDPTGKSKGPQSTTLLHEAPAGSPVRLMSVTVAKIADTSSFTSTARAVDGPALVTVSV